MVTANPDFTNRHPEWIRMAKRWKQAWDFYRGGVFVKAPDHETIQVRYAQMIATDSADTSSHDPGRPRQISAYTWASSAAQSYLYKHESETLDDYDERSQRITHFPLLQMIINIYVAGILRVPPRRGDGDVDERWSVYHHDVDLHGTDIDAFDRQTLALGMVFGRIHTVTDRPRYDSPAISQAQKEERGDRPYSYHLSPIDLVDWRLDEYRHLLWAVVREDMPDSRTPGSPPQASRNQYRVWYPDHWELWVPDLKPGADAIQSGQTLAQMQDSGYRLDSESGHPVGRVPIDTMYACREDRAATMECESPLASVLDLDRDILNRLSELDELERKQAFSVLWLPESEGATMSGVDIGPNSAIAGPADGGAPQYIDPNPAHATGKWNRIGERLFIGRQMAGAGRGKAEYSKEERSAAAITVESEDKRNQMAVWASALEEQNRAMHRTVLAWEGRSQDEYPEPQYNKDFDLKGTMLQIGELVQLKATEAMPPDAMAEMIKPIVAKVLRESGASMDRVRAVEAMIDAGEPVAAEVTDDRP